MQRSSFPGVSEVSSALVSNFQQWSLKGWQSYMCRLCAMCVRARDECACDREGDV